MIIKGGSNVRVVGCTIRNMGNWGVKIYGALSTASSAVTSTRPAKAAFISKAVTARPSPRLELRGQ